MERVMSVIDTLNAQYAQHPLWTSLASGHGGLAARAKLQAFAPAISYFILAFRDFNDFVLPYENPKSELEEALNVHALEDSTHYKLFLEDWEKLGGDALLAPYTPLIAGLPEHDHRETTKQSSASLAPSTRTLSFLWSDATNRHSRNLMFALTKLIHERAAEAPVRFAAVEAVEETGRVMFEATAKLANEMEAAGDGTYRYFGEYHLALETGHVINQQPMGAGGCGCDADEKFKSVPLPQAQEADCVFVVHRVFAIFTEWIDGIHELMQTVAQKE